jgi:hypothetical protein
VHNVLVVESYGRRQGTDVEVHRVVHSHPHGMCIQLPLETPGPQCGLEQIRLATEL